MIKWRSGSPTDVYVFNIDHFIFGDDGVARNDFDNFTNEINKLARNISFLVTLVSLQDLIELSHICQIGESS